MPDGKTHDMLTVFTGIVGIPIIWRIVPNSDLLGAFVWAGSHIVSGMAFSPDLDLASEPYNRWGPLRFIWWPYRELVPHRAGISHSLVFGPLFRLGYFLVMVWLSFYLGMTLINSFTPVDTATISAAFIADLKALWYSDRQLIVYALVGFVTGGAVHSIADWLIEGREPYHKSLLMPWRKRRRKRRRDDDWGW
ncbi:MAG TPA: hypothetical protein DEF47_19185 [Herpetosiphon sp.]|uniref:Uncharacterized metal-binding protein-like protein n=1 Tax=Herpetosiphon aurantiacus (strain ATCC 23779 / DSM 785 / 114-95) TaxID=316274 RepID=A9B0N7_HERA2|nr:metal-binding protein [Herpetosiphon sp.]ABX07255.1 uncharacterized metal-binding protein-like protein [Herpetosiphon aurantiacus DSM 785]MCA0355087.1 metal-binding protein [Chloroflexota bacterium]HBW52017.1 hypothetical protein [Herpetosiphon sp.]